jgi:cholesterol transport system auxiliary component
MTRCHRRLYLCVVFFAHLTLLTGCFRTSDVARYSKQRQTFVLNVSRPSGSPLHKIGAVLRIRRFRVLPPYEGERFVYRTGDLTYESDYYNRFLLDPSSMITEEVGQWLVDSGLFRSGVDFAEYEGPTYILEGSVTALYGDYSRGIQPKAALQIEFFLSEDDSGHLTIVFHKRYRREVPLKGMKPQDLVKEWNEALKDILTDLEGDLSGIAVKTPG